MIAFANMLAASVHILRREAKSVFEHAEQSILMAEEHTFDFIKLGSLAWYGWALVELGEQEKGISKIKKSIEIALALASRRPQGLPHILAYLGEAHLKVGLIQEALEVVEKALQIVKETRENWYKAELYRLKGEILYLQANPEAQSFFIKAIEIAHRQEAKSWELRASTSLARLLAKQGKKEEALRVLKPVYHWFSEGFDTADLKDAKLLLVKLSEE